MLAYNQAKMHYSRPAGFNIYHTCGAAIVEVKLSGILRRYGPMEAFEGFSHLFQLGTDLPDTEMCRIGLAIDVILNDG